MILPVPAAGQPGKAPDKTKAWTPPRAPDQTGGTITQWELINPHSWIHLDVKNEDATVTKWMIEVGSPNSRFRLGFTKNSLPVGTEILVDGYQAKDRGNLALGKNLTFPDRKRLFLGGSAGN